MKNIDSKVKRRRRFIILFFMIFLIIGANIGSSCDIFSLLTLPIFLAWICATYAALLSDYYKPK